MNTPVRLNISSHTPVSHLRNAPLELRISKLPQFLKNVLDSAVKALSPTQIILFGSRARGDETPLSDWELCFVFDGTNRKAWLHFGEDAEENARTLLKLDFVSWHDAPKALQENITNEGIVLYGVPPH